MMKTGTTGQRRKYKGNKIEIRTTWKSVNRSSWTMVDRISTWLNTTAYRHITLPPPLKISLSSRKWEVREVSLDWLFILPSSIFFRTSLPTHQPFFLSCYIMSCQNFSWLLCWNRRPMRRLIYCNFLFFHLFLKQGYLKNRIESASWR